MCIYTVQTLKAFFSVLRCFIFIFPVPARKGVCRPSLLCTCVRLSAFDYGSGETRGPQWPSRLQASQVSELSIPRWSLHSCENRKAAPSTNTGGTGETREPAANQQQGNLSLYVTLLYGFRRAGDVSPLHFFEALFWRQMLPAQQRLLPFPPVFICRFWTSESCGCGTLCRLDWVFLLTVRVCVYCV